MLLRRVHKKTRYGCLNCKQRRVKCDEQKPTCGNCSRLQKECSLAFLTSNKPQPSTTRAHIPSRATTLQSEFPPRPLPLPSTGPNPHTLDLPSLELLHHYTSTACRTLSVSRSLVIWQTSVPRLAFTTSSAFLIHGLLAISALHLASLQPHRSQELVRRAAVAEHMALPGYREFAANNSRDSGWEEGEGNMHAALAFGGLVVPCVLALSGTEAARLPIRGDVEPHWFYLIRGLAHFVGRSLFELQRGPFGSLLVLDIKPTAFDANPEDPYFCQIYQILGSVDHDDDLEIEDEDRAALKVCRAALDELRIVAATTYSRPKIMDCMAIVFMWPGTVDQRFVGLVEERRPEALVLLALFCVVLKKLKGCWFLGNLGRDMLVVIQETLDEKWKPWIRWAVEYPFAEDLRARFADGDAAIVF